MQSDTRRFARVAHPSPISRSCVTTYVSLFHSNEWCCVHKVRRKPSTIIQRAFLRNALIIEMYLRDYSRDAAARLPKDKTAKLIGK